MGRRTGLEVAAAVVAGLVLGTGAHLLSTPEGATADGRAPDAEVAGASVERRGEVPPVVLETATRAVLHVEASACGARRQASATLVRTRAGRTLLITNAHVVRGTSSVVVRSFEGRDVPVDVLGVVAGRDAALLDPDPVLELDGIVAAPTARRAQVGDQVVVAGHPGGAFRVQASVVDDVQRRSAFGTTSEVLVVGATVTGGASGGAVLDGSGAVVGLVAARDPSTGRAVAHPLEGVLDAPVRGLLAC